MPLGWPGGCGCCCPSKVNVLVSDCDGVVSGASVTITQGGTTLASGTTGSDGRFRWPFSGYSGDVTVSFVSGAWSGSQTITLPADTPNCPNVDVNFTYVNKICVHAIGCGGFGDATTVQATVGSQNCTTDATTNQCCITLTSPAPNPVTISAQPTIGGPTYTKSVAPGCSVVDFGNIYGKVCSFVYDCSGLAISGATVTLNATGDTRTTGADGKCCITPSAPITSSATLTATYPGLNPSTQTVSCAGDTYIQLLPPGLGTTDACCPGDPLGVPTQWCVTYAGQTFPITLNKATCANVTVNNAVVPSPTYPFYCSIISATIGLQFILTCGRDSYGNPILSLTVKWVVGCCISGQPPSGYTYVQGPWHLVTHLFPYTDSQQCEQIQASNTAFTGAYTVTNALNPSAPSVSGSVPATIPWTWAAGQCGSPIPTTTPCPNGGGSIMATPQVGGSC